jgi:hypothetical protein
MKTLLKKHFLFSFCMLPTILFSQEEMNQTKRVGVGVFVTPEYQGILIMDKTDRSVNMKPGCSIGAQMHATLGGHFVLRAGLGYSYRSFEYTMSNLIFGDMIDPQQGYTELPLTRKYDISFHEIQIPIAFHYRFSKPVFIGIGADAIIPFAGKGSYTSSDHTDSPYEFKNPINCALSLSVGYKFQLREHLGLLLEPIYRYNLRGYSLNNGHHFTAGLKTTLWIGGK